MRVVLSILGILLCSIELAHSSACNRAVVEQIQFAKGATCWHYTGKATHFQGRFLKGQNVIIEMGGEAWEERGSASGIKPKWNARNPQIEGPEGFFANGDVDVWGSNVGRLQVQLPSTGNYRIGFSPCVMWHQYGQVSICASTASTEDLSAIQSTSVQPIYPIAGPWAYLDANDRDNVQRACGSFSKRDVNKREESVSGSLINFERSKRSDYGGYISGDESTLVSVVQLTPNNYQIVESYYDDGESGKKPGTRQRSIRVRIIDENRIEITEGREARSFLKCAPDSSQGAENERQIVQSERSKIADDKSKLQTGLQEKSKPLAPSNAGPIQDGAMLALDVSDCHQARKDFISIIGAKGIEQVDFSNRSCKVVRDNTAQSGPTWQVAVELSCNNGQSDKLAISWTKTLYIENIFAWVAISGAEPQRYYKCNYIREAGRDGYRDDLVRKYNIVLTKSKLADIYRPYMYVKLCSDNGFLGTTNDEAKTLMSKVDSIASESGFDTSQIWSQTAASMAKDKMFSILKASVEIIRQGGGSGYDTIKMREGCDRFVALFQNFAKEYGDAQRGGPRDQLKKDF
jgi:hypothetical protein